MGRNYMNENEILETEVAEETIIDDEAALDKELEESLASVKAGKEPTASAEVNPEEVEEDSNPPVSEEVKLEFKLPLKSKFESDEVYEKRAELMDLIQRKKLATTDEQKQNLSEKIQDTRKEMKELSISQKLNPINSFNKVVEENKPEEVLDPEIEADKKRLRELGGATTEDIMEILRVEREKAETSSTLQSFISRHAELQDSDVRDVFFDFVDTNYNWQDKTGTELMTVLELARENMFKPSETIQERVLKGANVAEKVNAMQFPGSTGAKGSIPAELRASIEELKATGMSEEKALELLSD